jgi:hypothetical protein
MKKKTASSRDEIHEENCWSYTLGPQKKWRDIKKFESWTNFLIYSELSGQLEGTYWKNGCLQNPKQPFELQTSWEKKLRETVKKMEWNRNRPLSLIRDEEKKKGFFLIIITPWCFLSLSSLFWFQILPFCFGNCWPPSSCSVYQRLFFVQCLLLK